MIGTINKKPIPIVVSPGATNNKDTNPTYHRSIWLSGAGIYPEKETPKKLIPAITPVSVMKNSDQVNPSVTSNSAGEYTKTNGTSAFAIPSLNAVLPVLNGLDPAMPEAA